MQDPYVMYIIVRKKLNMSVGKIAAQCAHGVQMVLLKYFNVEKSIPGPANTAMLKWIGGDYRKVVLAAKESEWEKVKELDCFVVRDAGLTEVEKGSETVIALWPMKKSERPKVIKKIQVL